MDTIPLLIVLGFLAVFALIVYMAINTSRSDRENKRRLAQALGFTPVEPDQPLTEKIDRLYRIGTRGKNFQLQQVFRRRLPDGDVYLLDVIEQSGDDNSIFDQQAVAVVSSCLDLPAFTIYPKVDAEKYKLGTFANNIIRWASNFLGEPVDFPEYSEFDKKYIVSSPDPEPVRRYFDAILAQTLAQMNMIHVHADGDAFVFSPINTQLKKLDQNILSERINQGLNLFRILQK